MKQGLLGTAIVSVMDEVKIWKRFWNDRVVYWYIYVFLIIRLAARWRHFSQHALSLDLQDMRHRSTYRHPVSTWLPRASGCPNTDLKLVTLTSTKCWRPTLTRTARSLYRWLARLYSHKYTRFALNSFYPLPQQETCNFYGKLAESDGTVCVAWRLHEKRACQHGTALRLSEATRRTSEALREAHWLVVVCFASSIWNALRRQVRIALQVV